MRRSVPALVVALVASMAPAQVITTLKSYPFDDEPVLPPDQLARGEDGTLYGMSSWTVFRMQPDGSGFSILKQLSIDSVTPYRFIGHLALSGDTLYGATSSRTVFKINTDGTNYTVLKEDILSGDLRTRSRVFGAVELSGVVLSGDTLYGWGFKINTDGTGYTELGGFPDWDGEQDWHLHIQVSGDKIFGTTSRGGKYGAGTVFRLNTDGTGHTVLVDFPATDTSVVAYLTLVGDTLYGTSFGSTPQVFKVETNGTGYSILREFTPSDGHLRVGALVNSDGKLYSSSSIFENFQGPWTIAVFSMNMDGTGYTVLKRFTGGADSFGRVLTVANGTIYGLASSPFGFAEGEVGLEGKGGALFRINRDGTGFDLLKEFAVYRGAPDGREPGPLVISDDTLYGIVSGRAVFKMNPDGTGYTTLRDCMTAGCVVPVGRLAVSGSTICGEAQWSSDQSSPGGVFAMNTDGTNLRLLKERLPKWGQLALTLSGNTLFVADYGSSEYTEEGGVGSVFKLNADGTGFTVLHQFSPLTFDASLSAWTNGDGAVPRGELTLSGNKIYGTARTGGELGWGTVFRMNDDGTGFTVLKHCAYAETPGPGPGLTLSGDTLFGTSSGGYLDAGAVFRLSTNGTGFTILKKFSDPVEGDAPFLTNDDGAYPAPPLALLGTTLYGSTSRGGRFGVGTLFKMNTDGSGFTVLVHLQGRDGFNATYGLQGLVRSGTSLYGSELNGGSDRLGALVRIDLIPPLSIARTAAESVEVFWPTAWTSVVLEQKTGALDSGSWAVVTLPFEDDGTISRASFPITPGSRFFRLVAD